MKSTPAVVSLLLSVSSILAVSEMVPADANLEFEIVVDGLDRPIDLAFIGPDEFLVIQKNDGRVLRVKNGAVLGTVLDLVVDYHAERGLLSIVTDPDFINNSFVYLHYTEGAGPGDTDNVQPLGNRTYRYRWNGSALVEPLLILHLVPHVVHNGGVLAFGPDDMLYIISGDRGHGDFLYPDLIGKPHNEGTGHDNCDGGVILRLTPSGGTPADNPLYDPANPSAPWNRYFAYGFRNSFGIGFDPVSGDLWQTEAGQHSIDELNRVVPGMNGGWMKIHGFDALDPEGFGDLWMPPGAVYHDPQFVWQACTTATAVGFIESPKLGCSYRNDLLLGGWGCRLLYRFELDPSRTTVVLNSPELQDRIADNTTAACEEEQSEIIFATGPPWNSDQSTYIGTGPDGLVYFTSYNLNTVYRVQPKPGAYPDADGDQVDDACDCSTSDSTAYSVPLEVPRVRVAGKIHTTLGWNSQSASAGPGTQYAVVSGTLSDLRASSGFANACTLAEPRVAASADDRNLAPGAGFYYLTRAQNGCGAGTFGDGTPRPDPRDLIDTTLPPVCQRM